MTVIWTQSSLCNRGFCLGCVCTLTPFSRLTHYRFQNECVHNVSVSSCCTTYQPLNVWLLRDETHYWFRFQAASKSVRLPRLVMSFEDCTPDWAQLPKWHRHAGDKKGPRWEEERCLVSGRPIIFVFLLPFYSSRSQTAFLHWWEV